MIPKAVATFPEEIGSQSAEIMYYLIGSPLKDFSWVIELNIFSSNFRCFTCFRLQILTLASVSTMMDERALFPMTSTLKLLWMCPCTPLFVLEVVILNKLTLYRLHHVVVINLVLSS